MLATQLAAEGARGVRVAVTLDIVNDFILEMMDLRKMPIVRI